MKKDLHSSIQRIVHKLKLQDEIENKQDLWFDIQNVELDDKEKEKIWVKIINDIKNRYKLGFIVKSQYIYDICIIVRDNIQDMKILNGDYKKDLDPIYLKINEIENRHGLKDLEDFELGKGLKEREELDQRFNDILDEKYIELLKKYELFDVVEFYVSNKKEYDLLVEEGRTIYFGGHDLLSKILKNYKREFEKCKKAKAYYSGIIMAGSVLETYLLMLCLDNKEKIKPIIAKINSSKKKIDYEPYRWTLNNLLKVSKEAGLLPAIAITNDIKIHSHDIGNIIRMARNLLHPGKHIRDKRLIVEENNFKDIEAYYYILEFVFKKLEDNYNFEDIKSNNNGKV